MIFAVQLFVVALWLLASLVSGVLAIRRFILTGRTHSSFTVASVALIGSFLYFLYPKLGSIRLHAAFGMYPALVVATTALVLPLTSQLVFKRNSAVD